MQIQSERILAGHTEREKGAYLAALASLATADRHASVEEIDHLRDLANAAGLSPEQEEFIVHAASDMTGDDLKKCLDELKNSDLRYSLITDLIALAKADENFSDDEQKNIEQISNYLGVNNQQLSLLDQFVSKAAEKQPDPEQVSKPGFLDSLGLKQQFSNAGLNLGGGGMGRNLIGLLGPVLLGSIAAKALGGRRRSPLGGVGGGMLGGMLGVGGMMGGLGSLITGMNRTRSTGGLGSILGRIL